jgi:hypothetical protein
MPDRDPLVIDNVAFYPGMLVQRTVGGAPVIYRLKGWDARVLYVCRVTLRMSQGKRIWREGPIWALPRDPNVWSPYVPEALVETHPHHS